MIKDHEWLDLAVKNANRNVAEFIEKSCERHLNEHRVQFLPKIEHAAIDGSKFDGYLNMFRMSAFENIAAQCSNAMQANSNAYNSGGFQQSIGAMGATLWGYQ